WTGLRRRACYGASKGAVYALTLAMAADHAAERIRVNCVCPGTVDTPWVARLLAAAPDPAAARAALIARQPIGRLGVAEEIAAAIVYLASPAAGYTTGTALQIDGGTHSFQVPRPCPASPACAYSTSGRPPPARWPARTPCTPIPTIRPPTSFWRATAASPVTVSASPSGAATRSS